MAAAATRRFILCLLGAWLLSGASATLASLDSRSDGRFEPEPAAGRYLVARESMTDPRFRQTVILILHHDDTGTLGLIINRPSDVVVSVINEDFGDGALGYGGPVQPRTLSMLYLGEDVPPPRSRAGAEDSDGGESDDNEALPPRALQVRGGIHFVMGLGAVTDLHEQLDGTTPRRLYAGYAGWAPGQLEAELGRRSWHLLDGDPELAFSEEDSTAMWRRLIQSLRGSWL